MKKHPHLRGPYEKNRAMPAAWPCDALRLRGRQYRKTCRSHFLWALSNIFGHRRHPRGQCRLSFLCAGFGEEGGTGEGTSFCRWQRPKAAAGRARWRRRSFTGIDSRDEGLPSPQKAPFRDRLLRTQKAANVSTLAAFVGRTPGSGCYRCFLSNLTGLAVLPPSGLRAS